MSAIQTYDDRDPSASYSGDWQKGGTQDEYFQTTTYVRNATGATVTFKFTGESSYFVQVSVSILKPWGCTGTSVNVFGTLDSADLDRGIPISSYSVDNGQAVIYLGPTPDAIQYRQQFFQSPTLSQGSHTLLITVQSEAGYYLDYFTVTPNAIVVSSSSSSSSSSLSVSSSSVSTVTRVSATFISSSSTSTSSSSSSSFSSSTVTFSSSSISSGAQASSGSNPNASLAPEGSPGAGHSSGSSHLGVAVGGAIGGLAILMIALIAAMCIRRQRRVNQLALSDQDDQSRNQSHNAVHSQSLWIQNPPSTSQMSPFVTSQYSYAGSNAELGTNNPSMHSRTALSYTANSSAQHGLTPPPAGIIPAAKITMMGVRQSPPVTTATNTARHVASGSLGSSYVQSHSPATDDMNISTSPQGRLSWSSKGDLLHHSGAAMDNPPPKYER